MRKILVRLTGVIFAAHLLSGCAAALFGGVAAGASTVHDRRTAGTVIEDQAIELKILSYIVGDAVLNQSSHINVTSYNQVVLLSGEAANQEFRNRAEILARSTDQVRRVENEIVIAPNSPLGVRSNDTWLTTKVKGSMVGIQGLPGFDPTRVKVVTERGIVYLFGLLSAEEADIVTETARRVRGVQKVVKLFEPPAEYELAPVGT